MSTGVPLVFIHAFPLSSRMWDVNKPVLGKNFRFITVDLPGFGDAPFVGESNMESMARHVLQSLDRQNIREPFVVAGLSMGGYVMLQLLRLAPERVRAAAFLSTRSAPDTVEAREKRTKNVEFVKKEGSAAFAERMIPGVVGKSSLAAKLPVIDEIKAWIASTNPEAIAAALQAMAARPDTTDVIDTLKVPTLFLAGEEDTVVPASEMEALSRRVPKSVYRVVPQSGHLTNLEKPAFFNEAFLHFLKSRVL